MFSKKSYIAILFAFLLLTVPAGLVFAHVLKTDGNMGITLHIDPNDEPVANQPATLIFYFKSKQKTFALSSCNCTLIILNGSQQLLTQPLSDVGDDTAVLAYTFPSPAVYTIEVSGQPNGSQHFDQFSISYDYRVEGQSGGAAAPASGAAQPPSFWAEHWLHVVLFGLAIGANLFFFFRGRKKDPNKKTPKSSLPIGLVAVLVSSALFAHCVGHGSLRFMYDPGNSNHPCCMTLVSLTTPSAVSAPAHNTATDYTDPVFSPPQVALVSLLNNKSPPQTVSLTL